MRLDSQLGQQAHEVRVSPVVVNDEATVDWVRAAPLFENPRVGMAAGATLGLENRYFVLPMQVPRGYVACDSGADDRDLHAGLIRRASLMAAGTGFKSLTKPSASRSL